MLRVINMRLANYDRDSWELHFVETGNFSITDLEARQNLYRGSAAQLIFHYSNIITPGINSFIELMWVVISEVQNNFYIGLLYNQPVYREQSEDFYLRPGAEILFLPEHILDIQYPTSQEPDLEQIFPKGPTRCWIRGEEIVLSESITEVPRDESAELHALANDYIEKKDYAKAIDCLEQSLLLVQNSPDRIIERRTVINSLGMLYYSVGNYIRAIDCYLQQLAISQEFKDTQGEKAALGNLALAYSDLGEDAEATEYFQRYHSAG
jgi:tetratricopeptide (TPR) repeat protein